MIESVALIAPVSPPETGASSMSMPASARRAEMRRVTSGEWVVMSMWTRRGCAPSMMPLGPSATSSTSGASPTIVMTISLRSATSFGLEAAVAPSATRASIPGLAAVPDGEIVAGTEQTAVLWGDP